MIPDPVISAFEQLIEGIATPEQRERLYKVKDMLQVDPDDAVWLLAVTLEWHLALYEGIPQKIDVLLEKAPRQISSVTEQLFERLSTVAADQLAVERDKIKLELQTTRNKLIDQIVAQASQQLVGQLDGDLNRLSHQFELTHSRKAAARSRLAHWLFLVCFGLLATAIGAVVLVAFPQIVFGLRALLGLS